MSKEENILFAAEELFATQGFAGTSTREICKAANINISMISYYFGSKEKLYEKLVEYRMSEGQYFSKDILDREDLNEWEKLEKIVQQFSERVKKHRAFYKIMQREQILMSNPRVVEILRDTQNFFLSAYNTLLEKGVARGIFTKKPPVNLLHSTVSGTLFYATNSIDIYKNFLGESTNEEFEDNYYKELIQHIKYILKDLLGYEENK